MSTIKILEDIKSGNLPPIQVKIEERNIILIAVAAVVAVAVGVVVVRLIKNA